MPSVDPIPCFVPAEFFRSDPLEEHDASYLAASAKISSFFNNSMSPTHTIVHTMF